MEQEIQAFFRGNLTAAVSLTFMIVVLLLSRGHALTLFDDRGAWEAVTGIPAEVDITTQVPDGTTLVMGDPHGLPSAETLAFDVDLAGRQVPDSFISWSDGNKPAVLDTGSATSVTGTFGKPVEAFGLEMQPNNLVLRHMTLELSDGSILTQEVHGFAGAKFFGWTGGSVVDMTLSCDALWCGFAFGRMVEGAPTAAPEPTTLLLLASGLAGLIGLKKGVAGRLNV